MHSSVQEHITVFESNGTHPLPPYRIQPQRLRQVEKKLPYDYARCSSQMRSEKNSSSCLLNRQKIVSIFRHKFH